MPRLLIIEDDPRIVDSVTKALSLEDGFSVRSIADPEAAPAAAVEYRPDIILLDIRLPGGDGRQVLKRLKANPATLAIPVIFLTGMASEGDRVLGLDLGADDYVVKPFGALELLARIKAVLRRTSPASQGGLLHAGALRLDPASRRAFHGKDELSLQPKEFEVLYLLARHPGRTLSRAFLIENTSSYGTEVETRSLDTHIKNLRKKLGAEAWWIRTVHGMGYLFSQDGPPADA
ncbi:MAG: response regulator transcription factor [Elusimicrobia bacterium]|nr:response regulator transcription factor [Elusimicrobiota bacterium]